ncbi:hypothetical protein [Sorangium sp. So ce426]|uniref:hypothetical protein n=1 Tax=Sorangium sp. So ce426 TaxID=3133312 RepID=UPI003F5C2CF4
MGDVLDVVLVVACLGEGAALALAQPLVRQALGALRAHACALCAVHGACRKTLQDSREWLLA